MAAALETATLKEAVVALEAGEAVVFPTDTVVGLGVSVEAARSPQSLFDIKERDEGKPIAWLVGGPDDLARYGREVPALAFALAERFWPGPLTMIVRASEHVPTAFAGADGSIGLRMPNSASSLDLIRAAKSPLATTSANMAGEVAPATVADLDPRIAQRASCIYVSEKALECASDSPLPSGEASTVVSFVDGDVRVVREGAITMEDIESIVITQVAEVEQPAQTFAQLAPEQVVPAVVDEESSFPSADGASTIYARWWLPASQQPRAIVQIIHGMCEHIGRYDHFARFLAAQGFAVCGHDHIGHGRSVASLEDLGCLPPKTGKAVMVADVHSLRKLAAERFPELPHILFGHSMGSFVARAYVAKHGEGLVGAVICGTGNQPLALSKGGNLLANILCATKGPRSTSNLIHNMAVGSYGKAIPGATSPHDWISTDLAVIRAYADDPLCGYMFSVGGYAALTDLTGEVVTPVCAGGVPKALSLLYIAGAEDPVGECGKGVRAAADLVKKAGVHDVQTIIYDGMRHEILNEPGKAQVYADVLAWIEGRL